MTWKPYTLDICEEKWGNTLTTLAHHIIEMLIAEWMIMVQNDKVCDKGNVWNSHYNFSFNAEENALQIDMHNKIRLNTVQT